MAGLFTLRVLRTRTLRLITQNTVPTRLSVVKTLFRIHTLIVICATPTFQF